MKDLIEQFTENWKPQPAGYNGQWDEFKSELHELLTKVKEAQKKKDYDYLTTSGTSGKVENIGWMCALCDTPHFKTAWNKLPLVSFDN